MLIFCVRYSKALIKAFYGVEKSNVNGYNIKGLI
jgi:hypothetical protein